MGLLFGLGFRCCTYSIHVAIYVVCVGINWRIYIMPYSFLGFTLDISRSGAYIPRGGAYYRRALGRDLGRFGELYSGQLISGGGCLLSEFYDISEI